MAKKKQKKKASGKKSGGQSVTHIYYECASLCTANPHSVHVGPANSKVVLTAIDTDVTLTFGSLTGSPLKGRRKVVTIKANKSKVINVDANAGKGTYTYTIKCSNCATPQGPPDMIVP